VAVYVSRAKPIFTYTRLGRNPGAADAKASALAYFRLGRIAHKARDKARAIIFVKRALQEDPDLAEAHKLLDELK
jgi:hypothetical protein